MSIGYRRPVISAEPLATQAARPARSAARTRVLRAALGLFAEYGVSGTSLQMIADAVGVTKAAVYHQFKTKEAIVIAVTEMELEGLEAALEVAEAESSHPRALEVLLDQVIGMAVERRRWVSVLQNDPVVVRLLVEHAPFIELMDRLYGLLLGGATGVQARVSASVMSAAIAGSVAHPLLADIDDETLRIELLRVARRIFGFRQQKPRKPRGETVGA